ncbi:glycoside hydrolase family 53 protein [Lutibacter citreus]|uniref:glycoside hydrolase family 53 protein n=1 Tax=Lutibacter citreus TaxID=2138210 RepID=UPI000DBE7650|nr:glycosyl hydrolase 53 family protein [Lutibacter citreus]
MIKLFQIIVLLFTFISCNKNDTNIVDLENNSSTFITSVDISSYPEILKSNPTFFNLEGNPNDFLSILKQNGINTVRLRLWVNPNNEHSGFNEVKEFSKTLKTKGFKTWISLHYSDTWADPAKQEIPKKWQGLNFTELKDSVNHYTEKVVKELGPDYIQIGNEINNGLLHPYGNISTNFQQFNELMKVAIAAVRKNSNTSKIILHFAGIENSDWFFNKVSGLDYDIIGLSFYPLWHGKSLINLKEKMKLLSNTYHKKIVIAETAYPFTLQWNDWTNNIVGSEDQLILPDYPATKEGQKKFIRQIKTITKDLENGLGFCYWGAELISWKGNESINASPWENQALFDFNNTALPALKEFVIE